MAVVSMANRKSTGTDEHPAEIYERYSEPLLPALLETLNHAVKTGNLPPSMNKAVIVEIPKPSKHPVLPDSYRPISLINTDINLLARVLATRLAKIVSGLIHLDQSGFREKPLLNGLSCYTRLLGRVLRLMGPCVTPSLCIGGLDRAAPSHHYCLPWCWYH